MLRQVVNERVAEEALKRDGAYLTDAQVDAEMNQLRDLAKTKHLSLEQFTAAQGLTVKTFRHEVAWKLGWAKYTERHLADALEGYFKEHHSDFDGTQVRASHILLRPDRPSAGREKLIERAEKIRAEIEAGKLTFEAAADKYSAGPSRHQGGDLGFFPRFGVMTNDFAKTAFTLDEGKISRPVVTVFGVHLIRVTEIKPGTMQWTETIDQIRDPATLQLFDELAKQEVDKAKIEYTGKCPYLKPGTHELVAGDGN
jgi:parvulin-like peptidyl-prolyl isomerase